jgi:hypothetical protein
MRYALSFIFLYALNECINVICIFWNKIQCKNIQQVVEKSNTDTSDFEFIWDRSHCHLQTKFK